MGCGIEKGTLMIFHVVRLAYIPSSAGGEQVAFHLLIHLARIDPLSSQP
jgi:hypothetical protein